MIYCIISLDLFMNDRRVMGLVSPEVIQKQRQSHVMTLGGQALAFIGNAFALFTLMAFLNLSSIQQYVEEASYMLVVCFSGALTSIVDLYSSPEMRKFLLNKNY